MSIVLVPCPKKHTLELDKALPPAETIARVHSCLQAARLRILAKTTRIDTGRLGIPVYLSVCGEDAQHIMPTRKQMGKGATPEQAEASALMELIERFSFFSFWQRCPDMVTATWHEAQERFGDALLPIEAMLLSVHDNLPVDKAQALLNTVSWQFFPVTNFVTGKDVWVPLNWFKKLGEFNGTSAGNTEEESLLQGLCEVVERHVCCLIDKNMPTLPTIDPASSDDPVLRDLLAAFAREGITIILKDFSLNMPVPTVGAIAWDAHTLGQSSEIVYTAGTATSPAKAAIRAVTEIAQLAGDFCTNACYEASALSKYTRLEDCAWLTQGALCPLNSLPSIASHDISYECNTLVHGLAEQGFTPYALSTMHPQLRINAHYCFAPGMAFRERDVNQSLGLFVGRILAEDADDITAAHGLAVLADCCPTAHYVPFFQGMFALRQGDAKRAYELFIQAEPLQPTADAKGLATFYAGYTLTQGEQWEAALPALHRAITYCPDMKEFWNLRGVAHFKMQDYASAAEDFMAVLRIDKGSAMDMANLGLCHKFLGHIEEARHYLRHALDMMNMDPSLDFVRYHLAELESI